MSCNSRLGRLLAALIGFTSACAAVNAGIIYVDDDAPNDPGPGDPAVSDQAEDGSVEHPFDAIQEGIDAAVDGDEVVVLPGTYTGYGNRDLDFDGKAITVRGTDPEDPDVVADTVIDCQASVTNRHRGFKFHSGEGADSVLAGVTITRGVAPVGTKWTPPPDSRGGAIFCDDGASPTITNCRFLSNAADLYGGAIYCQYGCTTAINNCYFYNNWTGGIGGAIYLYSCGTVKVSSCQIIYNMAQESAGGGIACSYGWLIVTNCTISDNFAYGAGGGVDFYASTVTIKDSTISNNQSMEKGGAVGQNGGSLTMTRCTVCGNAGDWGGGAIYSVAGGLKITNCWFSDNSADSGGGIYCGTGSNARITNCAVVGNSAGSGAGIFCDDSAANSPRITHCTITANSASTIGGGVCTYYDSQAIISNSIVWGNSAPSGPQLAVTDYTYPSRMAVSYCDVQGGQAAVIVRPGSTLDWGEGNIVADPVFVDPDGADDDPATWDDNDYRLAGDSPCIDAGDNQVVPADVADLDGDGNTSEPTPLDLDVAARFIDDPETPDTGNPPGGAPIVDMGAYEFGLVATAWRSVREHTGIGDLAIELDPDAAGAAATCETRNDGIQKIEIDFKYSTTGLATGTVEVEDLTLGGFFAATNQYTINGGKTLVAEFKFPNPAWPGSPPEFFGLADETCYRIDLTGKILNVTGDTECLVRVLAGNTNGDDRTNLADMAQVKLTNGQPLLDAWSQPIAENVRFDVNLDGAVNLVDMAAVKLLNGNGPLTCP